MIEQEPGRRRVNDIEEAIKRLIDRVLSKYIDIIVYENCTFAGAWSAAGGANGWDTWSVTYVR
jgi:hypothetical protein